MLGFILKFSINMKLSKYNLDFDKFCSSYRRLPAVDRHRHRHATSSSSFSRSNQPTRVEAKESNGEQDHQGLPFSDSFYLSQFQFLRQDRAFGTCAASLFHGSPIPRGCRSSHSPLPLRVPLLLPPLLYVLPPFCQAPPL